MRSLRSPFARRLPGLGILVALVAVLTCATPVVAPATAGTPTVASFELGMQDDAILVNQKYGNSDTALNSMKRIGATRLRINMSWTRTLASDPASQIVPSAPAYDWRVYDRAVNDARAHGLRVQLTVYGPAPAWATGNHIVSVSAPSPTLFGQFLRDVATHFRGRVDRYGVWNEPNLPFFLSPQQSCSGRVCHHVSPGFYRLMYIAGAAGIRAGDPRAQILMGETAPGARPTADLGISIAPVDFLREMLCINPSYTARSCPALVTDGWATHPYQLGKAPTYVPPGLGESNIGSLFRFTNALSGAFRLGAISTPQHKAPGLFLTEFGYKTSGSKSVSEADQARYLSCSLQLAQATKGVAGLVLYQLMDPGLDEQFFSGLIRHDGAFKPSYQTLLARKKLPCPSVDATVVQRTPAFLGVTRAGRGVANTGIEVTCPFGGTGKCPVRATLTTLKRFPVAGGGGRLAPALVGCSSPTIAVATASRVGIPLSDRGTTLLLRERRLLVKATLLVTSGRRAATVSKRVFYISAVRGIKPIAKPKRGAPKPKAVIC